MRTGLPEPQLNVPIFHSENPKLLLGFADFGWRVECTDGTKRWVLGEYQVAPITSSRAQRRRDRTRRQRFVDDSCRVEWVWNDDMLTLDARRATCFRFARALEFPRESLDLSACEPRFFAQHRLDEAAQRDSRWRMRSA